ncbi:hypothetical protein V2J09_010878 [Rumex salicifolius]
MAEQAPEKSNNDQNNSGNRVLRLANAFSLTCKHSFLYAASSSSNLFLATSTTASLSITTSSRSNSSGPSGSTSSGGARLSIYLAYHSSNARNSLEDAGKVVDCGFCMLFGEFFEAVVPCEEEALDGRAPHLRQVPGPQPPASPFSLYSPPAPPQPLPEEGQDASDQAP